MPDQTPPVYVQQKPRGMSCLAKGCVVIASIVALIFAVLIGGGIYMQRHIGSFYGEQRQPLPANLTTDAQYQAALAKLQPLLGAAGSPAGPATIDLTADDLNALVAHDPRLIQAKDKCFFAIPGNDLSAAISAELEQQGRGSGKHYYYNVRLIGSVSVDSDGIRLTPRQIESFSGRPLPAWLLTNSVFLTIIDGFNTGLNKSIHDNTDLSALVAKIKAVRIQDGHMLLDVATDAPDTPTPAPVAEPPAKE